LFSKGSIKCEQIYHNKIAKAIKKNRRRLFFLRKVWIRCLSDSEVEAFLSRINRKSFASGDEEEVAGYAELMENVYDNYEVIPFNESYIKQLHQILLKYSAKDEWHRGEYKKFPNNVASHSLGENTFNFNTRS
jgi:hypothetical protein